MATMPRKPTAVLALLALIIPVLAGIGGANRAFAQGTPAVDTSISGTINVAMVANPQMVALQQLTGEFNKAYPNIKVNLTVLPENEIRDRITTDITNQGGSFDLVTVGTFEVPLWAKQGWLKEVGPDLAADPNYDLNDIFQSMRNALSYNGKLYGVPFYGESSMLFYYKDVFQKAGITLSEKPTWDEVAAAAQKLKTADMAGICLRGLPGWGEMLAPLDTVINTFGGRWYDENWKAQLDSTNSAAAIKFYLDLVKSYGEAAPTQAGFTECETNFVQKKVAMWYDATSAAELISDPKQNPNAENVGYAYAPTKTKDWSGWLWNWAFAIPNSTKQGKAAEAYMKWATSKDYVKLVVEKQGWGKAPTGARASVYSDPSYKQFAGKFSDIVLNSIQHADPDHPTVDPVPYKGVQYVQIPEFQDLGTRVSQEFAAAIAGQQTVDQAIKKANDIANQVAKEGGYQS